MHPISRLMFQFMLIALALGSVTPVHAQRKTPREDPCKVLVRERASAERQERWDDVIRLARESQFKCESLSTTASALTDARRALALGLLNTRQFSEALRAADQCLRLDARQTTCGLVQARAAQRTGNTVLAREGYRRTLQAGSTTDADHDAVVAARRELADLDHTAPESGLAGKNLRTPGQGSGYFKHWHAERNSPTGRMHVVIPLPPDDDDRPAAAPSPRPRSSTTSAPSVRQPAAVMDRSAAHILSTVALPPPMPGHPSPPPPVLPGQPGAVPGTLTQTR